MRFKWTKILPVAASIGVGVTAALAAKNTPIAIQRLNEKRLELNRDLTILEKVKTCAPVYLPAVASGAGTIMCIFGMSRVHKFEKTQLSGAALMYQAMHNTYKKAVVELYGPEAHQQLVDYIQQEHVSDEHYIYADCLMGQYSFWVNSNTAEIKRTFRIKGYLEVPDRYFKSTISNVLQAAYHLNRNYALGGEQSYADFLTLLGMNDIYEQDHQMIWDMWADGITWLDIGFKENPERLEDGSEIIDICFGIDPEFEGDRNE